MKLFLKILLGIAILGGLGAGGYYAYTKIKSTNKRDAFSIIPENAIFIIETENLTQAWSSLSENKIWKGLVKNEYFKDLNSTLETVNSFLKNNAAADILLKNRRLLVSTHMISGVDWDFAFVIDVEEIANMPFLSEFAGMAGYEVQESDYNGNVVLQLTDKADRSTVIYLTIIDNLLAGSLNGSLLENIIDGKTNDVWNSNKNFTQITEEVRDKRLFNFYFNYKELPKFIRTFTGSDVEMAQTIASALMVSGFMIDITDETLNFSGISSIDSTSSFIKALAHTEPAEFTAYNIISDKAAFYNAICFKNYSDFQEILLAQASNSMGDDFSDYAKNITKLESLLGVDLQKDFFSWIGNEIAFVKLQPNEKARIEDVIAIIHTKNIDTAMQGLDHLTSQVNKRTPIKFKTVTYNNFDIKYLEIKGFFRMFFGKLFDKLEKPYFTSVEDFMVFSNSQLALENFLDDYIKGKTLAKKESFLQFKENFEPETNICFFVQMPKMYDNMQNFMNLENKLALEKNKETILSFSQIGFSLKAKKGSFTNTLAAGFNEEALVLESIENYTDSASAALFADTVENLGLNVYTDSVKTDGRFEIKYTEGFTRFEGFVKAGKLSGLARGYYPSGVLFYTVNFENDLAEGETVFYYDDPSEKRLATATYSKGVLEGAYKEFYPAGARKAEFNYKDGAKHKEGFFYFETGAVKIEAEYRNGMKTGRWKYFDENGNKIETERWRKGELKGGKENAAI
ncbi:MAG TPA: hypothetical protein DCQ31_13630 [Bacteroidales bacterium]|nr:hypothetical protein [Bacteroidales bacterium]